MNKGSLIKIEQMKIQAKKKLEKLRLKVRITEGKIAALDDVINTIRKEQSE